MIRITELSLPLDSDASARRLREEFRERTGIDLAIIISDTFGRPWRVGFTNVAGRVAASASSLYARNLFNFIETLVDKSTKALAVKWDDELVKATALTKDGAVIHPNFQPKSS